MPTSPENPKSASGRATHDTETAEEKLKADAAAAAKTAVSWYDPWVTEVAGPKGELYSLVSIFGYVGPSLEAGRLRIYFDANLTSAVEIDAVHVVFRLPVPESYSPLGGSYLWIPSSVWARTTLMWRQN